MSTFNIDSTLQNITFNGNEVFKLIYNGIEVWSKSGPTPPGPTPVDYSREYFTVTSWEDGNTVTFKQGYVTSGVKVQIYYSYDKVTWTLMTGNTNFSLNAGGKCYFKGTNNALNRSDSNTYATQFSATKLFEVSGNILSLIYGDNFIGQTTVSSSYTFCSMFERSTYLLTARNLVLPVTTYNQWIYQSFFRFCTSLIYANKELPQETSQGRNTLIWFIGNCSKLQETPVVRLTTGSSGDNWLRYIQLNTNLKREIYLLDTSWPTNTNGIKYKSTNNTSVTGRVFSNDPNDYIHIWAEPNIPYSCYIEGCSDYFISGDSVTLKATTLNNHTFVGWYENDVLVSSDSTYTFTASTNRNLECRTQ